MAKKKNQHFVPQFYLKNFSIENNKKSIGLYNLEKELFVPNTSIKNQASEDFYYGKDGKIEEKLSHIENLLAPKISEIITTQELPKRESEEHIALLIHIIITEMRNPTNISQTQNSLSAMKEEILKFAPKSTENEQLPLEISHEEAIELSFSAYEKVLPMCMDLEFKLLVNKTNSSLITSDFPVIKYNQFLENKKCNGSIVGYGALGLQIFLPLNPQFCILFYDPTVYKVGTRKSKILELNSDNINQLNLLHFINCKSNIYFNEKVNEKYIKELHNLSKKYEKANQTIASSHGVIKDGKVQKNEQIIHMRSSDILIGLNLNQIKNTRKANSINLGNKISPMRHKAELILNKYYRQQRV